jgi:K+-sensing histidine kinase KdpD
LTVANAFTGFNVGISIPITFFSNASKIKSLDYKQQALQKEADNGKLILQNQLQNAFQQYNQNLSQYNLLQINRFAQCRNNYQHRKSWFQKWRHWLH